MLSQGVSESQAQHAGSGQESWTRLGGRRERCVVLFTDLVGFTARSNVMDAEALLGC